MERPAILYLTRRKPAPDAAFEQALRLARELDGTLTLLHVHRGPPLPPGPGGPFDLERLAHRAGRQGVPVELRVLGRSGGWAEELDDLEWDRWDLALKVAEPEGALRRRLGTTLDQRLARAPAVPVWFVPASLGAEVRVVLAGVDVSHLRGEGLQAGVVRSAAALAAAEGARLSVLHAWSLVGESILACPVRGVGRHRVRRVVRSERLRQRRRLEELAALGELDAPTTPVLVRGLPEEALRRSALSMGADVLVLGTRRRDGVEGLLVGNLAERFLARDGLGLLLVKPGSRVPRFADRGVAA